MKHELFDLDKAIIDKVVDKAVGIRYTIDPLEAMDMSGLGSGPLYDQNNDFLTFEYVIINSFRVGPTKVSPTRYQGDLIITYNTKQPYQPNNGKILEQAANWFHEQTVDGIRFRTFTPYPVGKERGFTSYAGVIPFDFELYRGE